MNPDTIPIQLVHVTNPSRFYFRNLLNEKEEIDQIQNVEGQIQSYVSSLPENYRKSLKYYQPKPGMVIFIKFLYCFLNFTQDILHSSLHSTLRPTRNGSGVKSKKARSSTRSSRSFYGRLTTVHPSTPRTYSTWFL